MTDLTALYEDLHQNPELSFAEFRTSAIAEDALKSVGATVYTRIGGTGVVGIIENGDGPVVWLRADMDALPLEEKTGLPYASTVRATGTEGADVPVMHACGHDMHVTWLIGAIEKLSQEKETWSGTVVAIFQPAEEVVRGAKAMVDGDLLRIAPRPDVVLGQHVSPLPSGMISISSGAAMAGVDSVSITLHGQGGHGSRPETTRDPVVAAASLVTKLQTVVSRSIPPGNLAVVTVGLLQAGTKNNIIPDEAMLGISLRSVDPAVRMTMIDTITRVANGEAISAGMTQPPTIVVHDSAAPTVNDAASTDRVRQAFREHFGDQNILDLGTVSGSEDVAVLSTAAEAPLVFWITGGSDPVEFASAEAAGTVDTRIPSNHSPFFAPVTSPTIDVGVRALVTAARTWLTKRD